jgi:hypothetical protein
MIKISVIVPTVLPDYPIWAEPKTHILNFMLHEIEWQDFGLTEVEVVIVDALHRGYFRGRDLDDYLFDVLHIGPSTDNWVIRNRKTNHALLRNVGLQAAQGEVVFVCDDTIRLPRNALKIIWNECSQGNAISPLVLWRCGDQEVAGMTDQRFAFLKERGHTRWRTQDHPDGYKQPVGWGPIAFPGEAAIAVNGYDEAMDAGTQLADTTFGARIARWLQDDHGGGLVIDSSFVVTHEEHTIADPRILNTFDPKTRSASTFNGTTHCNRAYWNLLKEGHNGEMPLRANDQQLSPVMLKGLAHCPYFREEVTSGGQVTMRDVCNLTLRKCEVPKLARQGMTTELRDWAENLRTFDLKELSDA